MREELLKCRFFRQLTTKVLRIDQQSFQGQEVYIWVMDRVSERANEWVNMPSIPITRSLRFAYSRVKNDYYTQWQSGLNWYDTSHAQARGP